VRQTARGPVPPAGPGKPAVQRNWPVLPVLSTLLRSVPPEIPGIAGRPVAGSGGRRDGHSPTGSQAKGIQKRR